MTTPRGGAREGAGRPPRKDKKSLPIWCGQMSEQDRALILERLTPEERWLALMNAAKGEKEMTKKGQTVIWEWDGENQGIFPNQTITNIERDEDGHVDGIWNGKHVAAFSLMCEEWYLI